MAAGIGANDWYYGCVLRHVVTGFGHVLKLGYARHAHSLVATVGQGGGCITPTQSD